ncbi:TolB family protein [Silvibacterium acidisoli]|uniref:TolB family protein n=1 Tax=Acidobacteriaceae bacterium ZG23-2 TaxID=2883246 RepID=UPI00406CB676
MKVSACRLLTAVAFSLSLPWMAHAADAPMRSRMYVYDLRTHTSKLIFTADTIWEAPNWSPDGKYLISNSGGMIHKLDFKSDGTVEEKEKLQIPADYHCNNDKAISPDGQLLAFSASQGEEHGSEVYVADADGSNIKQMTHVSPSYFHGWSPDNKTIAYVAQRPIGGKQYDIYAQPATGGDEKRLTSDKGQDDGPDYSPDGKWIYINSDRSGKEAVWRFPAEGAGDNDAKAEMVVSDSMQDWFPHIAPDGKKLVYIAYPAGTPTHDPRDVKIVFKLVEIHNDVVAKSQKTLTQAKGGQGSMNVNSWAPDSMRFAYVTYEAIQ